MSLLLRLLSGVVAEQPIAQTEWNWDEAAPADSFASGYQNADAVQPRPQDHEWDWSEPAPTDVSPTGYQNADAVAVVTPARTQEDWDWSESADDDWDARPEQALAASVVQLPRQNGDAEWDWDEAVFGEQVPTGFQNADVVVVASPARAYDLEWDFDADGDAEDGWRNHYTSYDPAERTYDLEWDWSEALFGDVIPTGFQNANVAAVPADPIQQFGFEWDFDEVLFTELVQIGFQNADNVVVASTDKIADLEWDFSADFGGEDGWSNHYTAYDPATTIYDDAWDWHEEIDDEWRVDQEQASFVPASTVLCQEDAWGWFEEVLFSDVAPTGYQNANAAAVVVPDVPANPDMGFDMRVRRWYIRRNGRILLFNSAHEADQWLAAEKAAEDAVKASNKTSRLARKRIRERVLKVNAAPLPEVIDQAALGLAIDRFQLPFDIGNLIQQANIEQILYVMELARQRQEEEDLEMLLLTM